VAVGGSITVEYVLQLLVDGSVDVEAQREWPNFNVSQRQIRGEAPATWRTASEISNGPELHDTGVDSQALS
jgi:hypothetical protein